MVALTKMDHTPCLPSQQPQVEGHFRRLMPPAPAMPPDYAPQEESLRQSQKMDADGQLAGGVAHDFNNLLTGILGNLSLVELELGPDVPQATREKLRSAIKAGERAAELVRQRFGLSLQSSRNPCSCDSIAGIDDDSVAPSPALPPLGSSSDSRATPGHPETILVVDDDELVRQVSFTLFSKLGYQVRIATDGAECLRIFAEGKEKIDLVLMDLTMPNLSGQETFRLLRQHHGPVPVLICTGDLLDLESFSGECGVRPEGFVHKPYRLDELAALVRRTLDARTPQE